jgi:hypothetical protein
MLENNRFGKYLLYALGEIVLVAIGILMALFINNLNEKRKNRSEVLSILKQVHSELAINILAADNVARSYMLKDSLIHEHMMGRVKKEDYNSRFRGMWLGLVVNYIPLSIQEEGFLNLMSHSKQHSSDLDTMISDLKSLYSEDVENVKTANDLIKDLVLKHVDWLKYNAKWSSNSYFNHQTTTPEELDFYLNSFYYRNIVSNYHLIGIGNHHLVICRYRFHAVECYNKLSKILQENGIEVNSTAPFNNGLKMYSGTNGSFSDGRDTLRLEYSDHRLKLFQNKNEEAQIISVAPHKWIVQPGIFAYANTDSTGKTVALQIRFGDYTSEYKILPD